MRVVARHRFQCFNSDHHSRDEEIMFFFLIEGNPYRGVWVKKKNRLVLYKVYKSLNFQNFISYLHNLNGWMDSTQETFLFYKSIMAKKHLRFVRRRIFRQRFRIKPRQPCQTPLTFHSLCFRRKKKAKHVLSCIKPPSMHLWKENVQKPRLFWSQVGSGPQGLCIWLTNLQ